MYNIDKRHKDTEKSQIDENIAENYKILKKTFFKSFRWYDIIHCCIRKMVLADISEETLSKRRIWVNIIICAQEGVYLISKEGAVNKKHAYLFQHQGHTKKMKSGVSWELCLNLCSSKWLRPRHSFVMYLIHLQL